MKVNKTIKFMAFSTVVTLMGLVKSGTAYADCASNYGGGETCVYNKNFDIEKKVRKEGDDTWKDKVTDVKKDEVVEFKIKVKNDGEVEVDDMKMKDSLPKEMEKVGGSGLTEDWDNFEPGETKTFVIKAVVKDSEYDRKNFEKCVVNKATAYYEDEDEASDTATVCYEEGTIKELPKTGSSSIALGLVGMAVFSLGTVMKKARKA